MDKAALAALYNLNAPAEPGSIAEAEAALGKSLPPDYADFLRVSNGLYTDGNLSLLEAEYIAQRNVDYEVPKFMPDYIMIGDDGGGVAVVMKYDEPTIFEVDMGVLDLYDLRVSAPSLTELLINQRGKTLYER